MLELLDCLITYESHSYAKILEYFIILPFNLFFGKFSSNSLLILNCIVAHVHLESHTPLFSCSQSETKTVDICPDSFKKDREESAHFIELLL